MNVTGCQNLNWSPELEKWRQALYTVQFGGCGDPGKYIHLTPNYVMNFDSDKSVFEFGPAGIDDLIEFYAR